MKTELVIARYDEDCSWANELPTSSRLVYFKGSHNLLACPGDYFSLSNIGREAHTYLWHIVHHYDSLADWTVFCQGNPFDHVTLPELEGLLAPGIAAYRGLRGCRTVEWDRRTGRIRWEQFRYWSDVWKSGQMQPADLSIVEYFKKYLHTDINDLGNLSYWQGAIFGVKSSCIHGWTKSFYKDLLASIPAHPHPEEAHYLERAWLTIFRLAQERLVLFGEEGSVVGAT